eukprot:Gb_20890 [translate_table: standard]
MMGSLNLGQVKKQTSSFLREKLRTARLALTDVTEAELMTEEATNSDPWGPETRAMSMISQSAFEVDNYCRIVNVLHKRLAAFDTKRWREPFKALVLLEYLLTHGPESLAPEFRSDNDVIVQLTLFQYVDDRGFDWGQSVRRKAERILELLSQEKLLKEERNRARKLSREIRGFGSFSPRTSSSAAFGNLKSTWNDIRGEADTLSGTEVSDSIDEQHKNYKENFKIFSKSFSSSGFSTHHTVHDEILCNGNRCTENINLTSDEVNSSQTKNSITKDSSNKEWQPFEDNRASTDRTVSRSQAFSSNDIQDWSKNDQEKEQIRIEGNISPSRDITSDEFHEYDSRHQSESLVNTTTGKHNGSPADLFGSEIHPFNKIENQTTTEGLLSNRHKKKPASILNSSDSAELLIKI